ncbi:MAG: DNA-formamidopyrimidine glycosylase family protein [Acidimicrobiales bacterium]
MGGRQITAARADLTSAPRSAVIGPRGLASLVGDRVTAVETRGKHLLMRLATGRVLHSHMRMHGSWHVYSVGEAWKLPMRQARLVLEADDRIAVCFNAPVVELLRASDERAHPSLLALGPDVLGRSLDLDEVRTRVALRPRTSMLGDLLLDQGVVCGIGNIYRCETLFLVGLNPKVQVAEIPNDILDAVFETARALMQAGIGSPSRDTGLGPNRHWVYGRTRRPCRRCRCPIEAERIGAQARVAYWCPGCQALPGT